MRLFLMLMAAVLLAACGDEGDTSKSGGMTEKAEPMQETAKAEIQEGMRVVDHSMDELEFELKRSINGLERMIEHYKKEGFDYSELEKKKKKLEKELANL